MEVAAVVQAVLLVQLSLLLLSGFTISAPIWPQAVMPPAHPPDHHHHHPPTPSPPKSPVHPPIRPPTKPPPKTPTQPPFQQPPPLPPPRGNTIPQLSKVAVQAVVYCKSCKYAGVDTLLGAKPLPGATVRLYCKNKDNFLSIQGEADKNGYFFSQPSIVINNFAIKECTMSIISSPLKNCSKPTNMNGGMKGSPLKPEKPSPRKKLPYALYSAGPFAFKPTCH